MSTPNTELAKHAADVGLAAQEATNIAQSNPEAEPDAIAATPADLTDKLRELHSLRTDQASVKNKIDSLLEKFRAVNSKLFEEEVQLNDAAKLVDSEARELAIELFNATGDKVPAPGATIRENTVLDYPEADALTWAQAHKMALVPESLDKKAFKDICKADSTRPDFVVVSKEASAAIATDLSKALDMEVL